MRFARYQRGSEPPRYGWVLGDQLGPVEGTPFGDFQRMEAQFPVSSVRLLAPVLPGKIICIGRNYIEHAKEQNVEPPELPLLFMKPPSAVIGPGDTVLLPPQSQRVEQEGELVVVIGRQGRWISAEDAPDYILGYTLGLDITARDLQRKDGQWTRGKGFDTFCPLGPWIETSFDPSDHIITCHVNEELRQMASTRDMIFTIPQLVAFISSIMTLMPGDIIMTGTPAGVGLLQPGDSVQVSMEAIGSLRVQVASEPSR